MSAAFARPILRTILVPLLAALFALAALAAARADGEKLADPARISHLALCLQSAATGGDLPAPDHDCGACSLAGGFGLPVRPAPAPAGIGRIPCQLVAEAPARAPAPVVHLPGSRAPPSVA